MEELIPITMFMCIAAVAILRPISTKLGGLLEAMKNEKTAPARVSDDPDIARMRVLMEHMANRMDLMEERMDFTERLLNGRRQAARDDHYLPTRDTTGPRRDPSLLHPLDSEAMTS
jgi:hypothetical protein